MFVSEIGNMYSDSSYMLLIFTHYFLKNCCNKESNGNVQRRRGLWNGPNLFKECSFDNQVSWSLGLSRCYALSEKRIISHDNSVTQKGRRALNSEFKSSVRLSRIRVSRKMLPTAAVAGVFIRAWDVHASRQLSCDEMICRSLMRSPLTMTISGALTVIPGVRYLWLRWATVTV